eukprot:scaffold309450_cov31-Tisochrysis_lutea.AAC.1
MVFHRSTFFCFSFACFHAGGWYVLGGLRGGMWPLCTRSVLTRSVLSVLSPSLPPARSLLCPSSLSRDLVCWAAALPVEGASHPGNTSPASSPVI